MTLDQTIQVLQHHLEGDSRCCHPERYDAIKLGKEALNRLLEGRKLNHAFASVRLPSETKD